MVSRTVIAHEGRYTIDTMICERTAQIFADIPGIPYAVAQGLADLEVRGEHFRIDEMLRDARYARQFRPWESQENSRAFWKVLDALDSGSVQENAPVIVAQRDTATMVLLRRQLTYHHVAQGEAGGEPWMVSF